jgi:hypothetical protein
MITMRLMNEDNGAAMSCRIVSPVEPKLGDIVEVEHFGKAMVKRLSHNSDDNFITLTFEDVLTDEKTFTHRFSVL